MKEKLENRVLNQDYRLQLKETNFIQRLKGLEIVTPPSIDDKKIIDENVAKLTSIINDDNLLE